MTTGHLHAVIRRLRGTAAAHQMGRLTDSEVLDRFVHHHDEGAFELLVWRHGGMVLSTCLRVLRHAHDAEDAFQATFLAFVRQAASIGKREAVAGWLYKVAYRTALRAKAGAARRARHEKQSVYAPPSDPASDATWDELRSALDEELNRLPERYRVPFVLCYLEGKTAAEAARQLGRPRGTVLSWLARARDRMRARLGRRGLALSTGVFVTALSGRAVSAAGVPAALVDSTVKAATLYVAGNVAAGGFVPSQITALAEGVLKAMLLTKLKVAAVVLASFVAAAGMGLLAYQALAAKPPDAKQGDGLRPRAKDAEPTKPDPGRQVRTDHHGDPLPEGVLARLGTVRLRHGGSAFSAAFSPDGKVLASAGGDGAIRFWDVTTGKELLRLVGHDGLVFCVAFSPDGKVLASGGWDDAVSLWDVATGKELHRLKGHQRILRSVRFSPDGKMLASASDDKTIRLWDVSTGKELRCLVGHTERIWCPLAFAPDGRTLTSGSRDETIRLWDVTTGKEVGQFLGHSKEVNGVDFAPDGKTLASSGADNTLRLWDVATGKELRRYQADRILSARFSPDGKTLAAGIAYSTMRFWDVAAGTPLPPWKGQGGGLGYLTFSRDGAHIASWGDSGTLRLWEVSSGKELHHFAGHQHGVKAVDVSPDGRKVVTAGGWPDNTVRLWEADGGKELRRWAVPDHQIRSVAFSPDGKLLAGGGDHLLRLWDAATGTELPSFTNTPGEVESVAFSPAGKTLAAGRRDASIVLWEVDTGKQLLRLDGHQAPVSCVVFSPDRKVLVSGAEDATIRFWDVATGRQLARDIRPTLPLGPAAEIAKITFSPDGKLLASLDSKNISSAPGGHGVRLWDVGTGKEVGQFLLPQGLLKSVAFSPDGRALAGGDTKGTIRLWELATGKERCQLRGHQSPVTSLKFSPDGSRLVSGSDDTTALVWDLTGHALQKEPRAAPLADKELEGIWTDLASEDAAKAYRALGLLVRSGQHAVPFLERRLRPAQAGDPKQIARMIADLDSDRFDVRERAAQELEKLGDAAEPALRKAMLDQPPAETRRRVEQLLESAARSPERLRTLRALEALEQIDTPEARRVLQALARGLSEAKLTQEAKAAVERVSKRTASKP